jgi:hypothetical protein
MAPPRCASQAALQKLKADLKKASFALVDTGAARDELLSRAELGARHRLPPGGQAGP